MTILFFDDTRLYNRVNMKRDYETPEVIWHGQLQPNNLIVQMPIGVWREEDGIYRMVASYRVEGEKFCNLAYTSRDGFDWEPDNRAEQFGIENPVMPNECLRIPGDPELGAIFYDKWDVPERKYKALVASIDFENEWVDDDIWCSADLFTWKKMRGACWNTRGAEPGASVYRIEEENKYAVLHRPTWGDRRICVSTTDNFQSFSKPSLEFMPDSEDDPLIELYGMRGFAYKGMYIAFLWIYHTLAMNGNKFWGGKLDSQLAYSLNGTRWFRSLRKPFMACGEKGTYNGGMVFPTVANQLDDGTILIYGGAYEKEHAHFWEASSVFTAKLREDGFVSLAAGEEAGMICTRPIVLLGDIDLNVFCPEGVMSCAVYGRDGKTIIEGFTHDDFDKFTGDSTHFVPTWKGKTVAELKDKGVCLEIKLTNGKLFAISGDFVPLTFHEAARYEKFGIMLDTRGF